MQKRSVLNSPSLLELKKKRRQALFSKIFFIAAGLLVVIFSSAYFSRLEGLNIEEIKVDGNRIIEESALKEAVNSELAGKYAFLFPKTNVLIYPKSAIRSLLLERFPRLTSVALDAKDRRTLSVTVAERDAAYLWCGENISESTKVEEKRAEEKCYFMDGEGYIFDEAPFFSGEVYFKFYGSSGNSAERTGSYFMPDKFEQLESFKDVLAGMGLKPVIMHILDEKNVEVYLARAGHSFGPKIMFRSDTDLKNTAENLQAALTTDPLMSRFKNKYSSLEYIDIRFGNRVYFKFNEQ